MPDTRQCSLPCPLPRLARCAASILMLAAAGCISDGAPRGTALPLPDIVPLVDVTRYSGTWYEIARLPHFFEKNLENVTATYTLQDNGTVKVYNRGYHSGKAKWQDITGKAWRHKGTETGLFKVRFFWPFSADYRIIALDAKDYRWAVVSGPNRNYLWILARTPVIDEALYTQLVQQAADWGFDTPQLIRVKHDPAKK